MTTSRREGATDERGASLVEIVLVLGLIAVVASFATPVTAAVIDASRARQAAGFSATRLRFARQQAAARSASTGLVFDQIGGRWVFSVCVDGNGNGLRRADLTSGKDTCPEGPFDLATMFPGVQVVVDGDVRGPDGEPPSPDPVRFGNSNLASFSPTGTCTSGSLFLRSAKGIQYAVRIAGVTGRVRILQYDVVSRMWRET